MSIDYRTRVKKYHTDIETMRCIGSMLKDHMREIPTFQYELAERLSEDFHIKKKTAEHTITQYFRGGITPQFSDFNPNKNTPLHLKRFSTFCSYLNIEKQSEIIKLAKTVNSNFRYPPK